MNKENILKDAWLSENKLNISINNLPELGRLITDIELKKKELQKAVQELNKFYLEVNFSLED